MIEIDEEEEVEQPPLKKQKKKKTESESCDEVRVGSNHHRCLLGVIGAYNHLRSFHVSSQNINQSIERLEQQQVVIFWDF